METPEDIKRTKITLLELAQYIGELQRPPYFFSLAEIAEQIGKNEKFCRRVVRIAAQAMKPPG